jgi:methionine-rich copper-binding protein CopC
MHGWRGLGTTFAAALLVTAVFAVTAFAHAELLGSKPRQGQTLERSPSRVVLTFSEGIDTGLVQLQVEDAAGRRADLGEPFHPGGREELVAVRLKPRLEGRYVASYRVISEDGHPVAKQTAFKVRPPKPAEKGEEPEGEQMAPPEGGGTPQAMDEGGEHADTQLGGTVLVPPFDALSVRMTSLADPQGATFTASRFTPENKDLGG